MSLTSGSLYWTVVLAALVLPLATVIWRRRRGIGLLGTATTWGLIVLCQVLAITATGLAVNRQYGFYSSWSDVAGQQDNQPVAITTSNIDPAAAGNGSTLPFVVRGPAGEGSARALAWLPPGYSDPANAHRRYPVLVVLPGYANTVESTYANLDLGRVASDLIGSGRMKPFITVVAPYQTLQGRDTECTDIKGAKDYRFLTRTVPASIRQHVRADAGTQNWAALGWSTGGYCATKAMYASPFPWGSAVSMGGYFEALTDSTTGNLYPTKSSRILNSPSELYRRFQMPSTRLLVVASRADRDAWKSSAHMTRLAKTDPNVSAMWLPSGGHNYGTYAPHLASMIEWALMPRPTA